MRIRNSDAVQKIRYCNEFSSHTGNFRGEWFGTRYIVYSYATPIMVVYFSNEPPFKAVFLDIRVYSHTTSRHTSFCKQAISEMFPNAKLPKSKKYPVFIYMEYELLKPALCRVLAVHGVSHQEGHNVLSMTQLFKMTKEEPKMIDKNIKAVAMRAKDNIRDAIEDYARHTRQTTVLDDISDEFINRLAWDSSYAKQGLRELFRKSPVWNEELDAIVINGTRTHNPDPGCIKNLVHIILADSNLLIQEKTDIEYFFAYPYNETDTREGLEVINRIAPNAYKPGKKLSRVFKAICVALGIADDTAGSHFQRRYAQLADELSAKKIDFKLFVSINPAHFLTMSNPKQDNRGAMMTSCHSINSTELSFNCGCTGYARDKTSFIVFTVDDPTNPESLNNRKTTRQIFAYRPGNGVLLQSRFYNTSGGTRGAVEESKLYRDLIQREISALEGVPNLWRTRPYCNGMEDYVHTGCGFGGYADWEYEDFDGKVSVRNDHKEDWTPLEVGTYGLCVVCAEEIGEWMYCGGKDECYNARQPCDHCGELHDPDVLQEAYNEYGHRIVVCPDCLDKYFAPCNECGRNVPIDCLTHVEGGCGAYYCNDCLEDLCEQCDDCAEYFLREDMHEIKEPDGRTRHVCDICIHDEKEYLYCDEWGNYVHQSRMRETPDGTLMCEKCWNKSYATCKECGVITNKQDLEDGVCPECRANKEGVA